MEKLLHKFQPGTLPHAYVLKTIGSLAIHNRWYPPFLPYSSARGFVPFLSDVLNRCIPMLSNVKIDNLRYAFSVGQLC